MAQAQQWVRFNEYEDAVAAIELVGELADRVKENPTLWKWIVMGMQNAMQAAMVLALQGTDGCGALRDKSAERPVHGWQTRKGHSRRS